MIKIQNKATDHQLHGDFVKMLRLRLQTSVGTTVVGYTKKVVSCSGIRTQFYAHPCFLGRKWYDWALVHFEEQEGSGSAMTKAEPAARQGRERQRDDEGRTGGATMKGAAARR